MIINIILILILFILGFIIRNLLIRTEKQEDIIVLYSEFLSTLSKIIDESDVRLREIDSKEMFKSDDEIGWFFEQVKIIQNNISKFKIN